LAVVAVVAVKHREVVVKGKMAVVPYLVLVAVLVERVRLQRLVVV
tara:strand:- start:124 stop:258 length:135 start_codon:yes stop_codon:yes gene_type:complete